MAYLNVAEVETAIHRLASNYPEYCHLVALPHKTHENRSCHALVIKPVTFTFLNFPLPSCFFSADNFKRERDKQVAGGRRVLAIAGQHAREWVPPDALVYFAQMIIRALRLRRGLIFGGFSMRYNELIKIFNHTSVILFPQVNPDGRHYSMTEEPMWRKNRRPAPKAGEIGVDLNRNYNFLWNFPQHFNSSAYVASSVNAVDETYIGPDSGSEPEVKNVNWLCNRYRPHAFVDVHSYSGYILYNWADDNSQVTNPSMSFQNLAYDGTRGMNDDAAYNEYIRSADSNRNQALAAYMVEAIEQVNGDVYTAQEWVDMYPASGTSTDFQQSLSYLDKDRTRGPACFCIESGRHTFQPTLANRAIVIKEVNAALITLMNRL